MNWWFGFISAFLASAVEVVEAVTIVLAAGVTRGWRSTWLGVVAAIVVITVAAAVHAPLSKVPENTLKFAVGIMLTGFGTFWAGKGVGLRWPGEDLAILGLIAFYALVSGVIIFLLRQRSAAGVQKVSGI